MTDTAAVASWYGANAQDEHARLLKFSLEYRISLHVILDCVGNLQRKDNGNTTVPLNILDLGGGTGRYAVELAKHGHNVTLADISAAELDRARTYASKEGVHLSNIAVVDATQVSEHEIFGHNRYDLILCQGPLYHLLHSAEREKLLRDCTAMCKPGGFVLPAFVTKWAHLRDLAQRDPNRLAQEAGFYGRYVQNGVYDRVPTRTSYHVSVEDIGILFEQAFQEGESGDRLEVQSIWACESFLGGGISQHLSHLPEAAFEEWFKICLEQANKPELFGASDHLLVVARKG